MKENQRCGLVANAQHFAALRSQRGISRSTTACRCRRNARMRAITVSGLPIGWRTRARFLPTRVRSCAASRQMAGNALWA
jgi:hypothetical protein